MSTKRLERATVRLIKALDKAYDALEEFNLASADEFEDGRDLVANDSRVQLKSDIGKYHDYLSSATWWKAD